MGSRDTGNGGVEAGGVATTLLRLALDPHTGRLGGGRALDVCLRAGLFCDLALAGVVRSADGVPVCADPSAVQADSVLFALARAVQQRPGVTWRRWFTNVRDDRAALIKQLVAAGVWTHGESTSTRHVLDLDPAGVAAMHAKLRAVQQFARGPHSAREAALAYLNELGRGERGKVTWKRWAAVLPPALGADTDAQAAGPTLMACLRTATSARRGRGLLRR